MKGRFFYWYMMQDIYSRKLVVNEVHDSESVEYASHLLGQGCLREQTAGRPLVLHSDNGTAMKGATMRAALQYLGVVPSYSRPRVSNDNGLNSEMCTAEGQFIDATFAMSTRNPRACCLQRSQLRSFSAMWSRS